MLQKFRHALKKLTRSAFDSASGGRRWENAKSVDSLNAAILAGATVSARRAGYYARNNPWVCAAVQGLVSNAVGTGIKPRSRHPDNATRKKLHALWNVWTDSADASGLTDFYGLQALALRSMIESGETFARIRIGGNGLVPLQIELLDREQVPMDLHREINAGARIRAGVEFDANGARVAYHVYRGRPGDPLSPMQLDLARLPASDMIHLFQVLAPGQLRGMTWLAPILLRLHELDQYEDATLVKAKVAALFTGFIRDPDGTVAGLNNGSGTGGVLQVGMEPGSLIPLPPGADIQFSDPADPGDYSSYVKNHIRAIASGLGLPYELVSGDLEGVTYSSIRAGLARVAGLDQSFIDTQIDANATADETRKAAFDTLAQRGPNIRTEQTRIEIVQDHDEPAVRAQQMGEALYARINPSHQLSEPARRYAYATCADMAKEILTLRGASVMGLSPATLITRALHTTSDFGIILGDTVGRALRAAYQAAPSGIRLLGRQTTARDFRAVNKIMLGEAPLLEKLNEHGEIKSGTMVEAKEAYRIETFAKKIGITRQVLVNDDLGAFSDLSRRMGQAAAETEAQTLVALLESSGGDGPIMNDSKTLFHASHGNTPAVGGAIGDTTLSDARLAMRTQRGLSDDRMIRVTPKYLLVPPALETTAEKWLATIAAAKVDDVNPFSNRLTLVVEPRLTSATRWYVTADAGEIDGLEYAYLAGGEGPQVESKSGWDVDGVEVRVILDYGAGFVDWRGWHMNEGA